MLHHAIALGQPDRALSIVDSLYDALGQLETFPLSGSIFEHDELEHPYRRILKQGYWIYYELEDDTVIVRRIFHETQDIDDYALL